MKVLIEIKCDNASFEDDPSGELSDLLEECRRKIERRFGASEVEPEWLERLLDSNGNTVGKVEVTHR